MRVEVDEAALGETLNGLPDRVPADVELGCELDLIDLLAWAQRAAVAKLEKRADMYVGSLRRYVEALGGKLEITARFPEGAVVIVNFGEIGKPSRKRREAKSV